MSNSFFNRVKQTLGSLGRPKGGGAAHVQVAIFGKHPGWDDHIPDLGLTQLPFIEFKQWLYDGITRNIDNGEWDKLRKSGKIEPFSHTLLYMHNGDCIAGRIWQSVDGKGRDRYPMIAAALCSNLPTAWVIREVVPALKSLQEKCVATRLATDVEQLYRSTENALRQAISSEATSSSSPAPPGVPDAFRFIADRAEMGENHLGLLRLLYHIEREMPQTRSSKLMSGKPPPPRSFALRVPPCADSMMASAELWMRFLSSHPEMTSSLCTIAPDHAKWLDIIAGIPTGQQLFCLCAPLELLPLTTDVPYTLDPDFVRKVTVYLDGLRTHGSVAAMGNAWP